MSDASEEAPSRDGGNTDADTGRRENPTHGATTRADSSTNSNDDNNVVSNSGSEQSRGSLPSDEGHESLLQRKWEEMFNRLLKYKETHGDCLVPNRYPEDPQLGNWVSTQRRQYKALQEGAFDSTPMTQGRAEKLERIGFKWFTKDPRHVPWTTRYRQLIDFKEKYGHSQVPIGWEENIQLSNWVSTQRQEYKLLQRGKTSRLTDDRIELLNKVDFIWEAQRGGPRRRRKATVQVPPKANPVERIGPLPIKHPAYGTTNHEPASLQGFRQGCLIDGNATFNNNNNINAAQTEAATQLLQNVLSGNNPQTPSQHLLQNMLQGSFQAQGPLPQNVMLPMATAHYTQWLAALSTLANLAQQQNINNNVATAPAQTQTHAPIYSSHQLGSLATGQHRLDERSSYSPKTVSLTESCQRDSDGKTSENGDSANSDEFPDSS